MAFTKAGTYMMNPQRAAHADKMAGMGSKPMSPPANKMEKGRMEEKPKGGEMSSTWTSHEGGMHSTDSSDGETMQHGSAKEALAHMAMKHGHEGLADHIMMHDGEDEEGGQNEEPMPDHGHMLVGL